MCDSNNTIKINYLCNIHLFIMYNAYQQITMSGKFKKKSS